MAGAVIWGGWLGEPVMQELNYQNRARGHLLYQSDIRLTDGRRLREYFRNLY